MYMIILNDQTSSFDIIPRWVFFVPNSLYFWHPQPPNEMYKFLIWIKTRDIDVV